MSKKSEVSKDEHLTHSELIKINEILREEIQMAGNLYVKAKEELEKYNSEDVVTVSREYFEDLMNIKNNYQKMVEVISTLQGTVKLITEGYKRANEITIPELSKTVSTLTELLNKK